MLPKNKGTLRKSLAFAVAMVLLISAFITTGILSTSAAPSAGCTEADWDQGAVYTGGNIVCFDGQHWKAKWWTQGEQPGTSSVWEDLGPCPNGATPPPTTMIPPTPPNTNEFSLFGYIASSVATNSKAGFKVEVVGTSFSATSDSNGYYEIPSVPMNQTYHVKFSKAPNHLARTVVIEPISYIGAIQIGLKDDPVVMWPGDIAQDGAINMTDIMKIIQCFNSVKGDGKYNPACDLNEDNVVNMSDIMIIVARFNKLTSDYPEAAIKEFPIPSTPPTTPPTMTPTPTPTVTGPTQPPNTTLPKRVMVGYWHTWGGNNPFIKLRDVDPNWDVINIAFTEPVRPGSRDGKMKFEISGLSTVSNYTINDFKADVKLLQSQGKKVVLSIGGYEGWFILDNQPAVNQFVSDIKRFVDEYGFDGIDIDFEQDSIKFDQGNDPYFKDPKSPRIIYAISAIRQIMDSYDDDFMLTWAPETFYLQNASQYYAGIHQGCMAKAGCYIPLIHALRDKTTFVHAQLYNSTPVMGNDGKLYNMGTTDGVVEMCKMLLDGFKIMGKEGDEYFFPPLRQDQVVIGVPASASAANSGQISNANLQQAFSTLVQDYPDLRGIMTWSINWDNFQNGNSFAKENRAYLDTLD